MPNILIINISNLVSSLNTPLHIPSFWRIIALENDFTN